MNRFNETTREDLITPADPAAKQRDSIAKTKAEQIAADVEAGNVQTDENTVLRFTPAPSKNPHAAPIPPLWSGAVQG